MAFGDSLALIKGDQPQPSFTGITGRKATYSDDSTDEREQNSKSE